MIDSILDTNVIIYFVQGLPEGKKLLTALDNPRLRFGISVVTETELFAKQNLSEDVHVIIEEIVSFFQIVEMNSHIARIAAIYRKNYRMKLGDAIIAATAKYLDIPLWTYNVKDFKRIPNLVVLEPK